MRKKTSILHLSSGICWNKNRHFCDRKKVFAFRSKRLTKHYSVVVQLIIYIKSKNSVKFIINHFTRFLPGFFIIYKKRWRRERDLLRGLDQDQLMISLVLIEEFDSSFFTSWHQKGRRLLRCHLNWNNNPFHKGVDLVASRVRKLKINNDI